MVRSAETIEGLAVAGRATLGRDTVDVPQLLWTRAASAPAAPDGAPTIAEEAPGPANERRLSIRFGTTVLPLHVPIEAPEIARDGDPAVELSPGIWTVRGPLDSMTPGSWPGAELIVLTNARALWSDGAPFVRTMGALRAGAGAAPIVWAPRVALPHRIPLLTYLGVDWLDTTEGAIQAAHGTTFDETLGADRGAEGTVDLPRLGAEYTRAVAGTRSALARGRLRELVEARLAAEPAQAEMLRYADRFLAAALEERTPVVGDERIGRYVLAESLRRPEMRRFRARLVDRYRPPASKEVLLLVPCSRTKPYRRSRSHRRFASAWEGFAAVERLHVVSVSSPIGVVPRELEDVHPARHYDIPVTGDWSDEERELVLEGLRAILAQGRYRSIVVHLDPGEYDFLREALPSRLPTVWTLGDHRSTSPEAINSLRASIRAALEGTSGPVPGGPLRVVREELAEVAAIQFGRPAAARLFADPCRLAGRPWFQRVTDGEGTDLASWKEERGLFQLTIAGAERFGPEFPLRVEAGPDVPLRGDLFAPGVRAADPMIRTGDAVVVTQGGALAAVGEAAMSGRLMTELGRGIAVHLRHRRHAETP